MKAISHEKYESVAENIMKKRKLKMKKKNNGNRKQSAWRQ